MKNAVLPREKGGSTTNFPTRKEVRMWNLIAGSFTNSVLFRSFVILFNTSRSTIQYRRTSSFEKSRKYLEENADEWDEW